MKMVPGMYSAFYLEVPFLPPELGGFLLESILEGFLKLIGTNKWDQDGNLKHIIKMEGMRYPV